MTDKETIKNVLQGTTQVFSATFIKADGTAKKAVYRTNTRRGVVMSEDERRRRATTEPEHILRVWEIFKQKWSSINLNTLTQIKMGGQVYNF